MLADHLPRGRWEEADEVTREQTKLLHLMVVAEPRFTVPFRKYFFDSSDVLPRGREGPTKSG